MSTEIYLPGISPEQIASRERETASRLDAEETIRRLRRRLRVERSLFSLALAGAAGAWAYPVLFPAAWAVYVDGKPVVAMRERGSMAAALERLKQEQGGGSGAAFVQNVRIDRCDPNRVEVADSETAMKRLTAAVQLSAPRAVIYVDGEAVAALPEQSGAVEMLAGLKSELAPELPALAGAPVFKEKIEVRMEPAHQELWAEADEARGLLKGEGGEESAYTVRAGDTGEKIAQEHNLSVARLEELNPGVDLHRIRVGQSLSLEQPAEPLVTVLTEGEVTEVETVSFETEVRRKPSLYVGKRFLKRPGQPGRQRVTYRVRYENEREVQREELSRSVVEAPQPKIVVIGGKPRP